MAGNKTRLYIGAAVIVSILVLFISLMATSWAKLDATQVGVAYDIHQKILSTEVKRSGLHNGSPGFKFIKFPSVFKSLDFPSVECLNKEGIEIVLNVQLQYRARSKDLREIILQFENHDNYVKLLRGNGEAVIRQACSSFRTAQFQAQRPRFQVLMRRKMAQRFDSYQADVNDVQVKDIQRPGPYEEVIRNKEVAKEKVKIVKNERPRQLIQAKAIREEAKIQGNITIQKAASEAKVIILEALGEAEGLTKELEFETDMYKKHSGSIQTLLSHMFTQVIINANNTVNIALDSPVQPRESQTIGG